SDRSRSGSESDLSKSAAAPVPTPDATDSGVGQRVTAVSEVRRSAMSRIFTQRRSAVPAAPSSAAAVAANDEFLAPMPLPRRLRAGTNASSEDDLTESESDSADSDSAEDSGSLGSDLGRLGYAQLDFKPRLQADWHGETRGQQRGPVTVEYTELAPPLGASHKTELLSWVANVSDSELVM
uniref:Tub domain-containing protein n=1 Tax=Macrostomum lignano TaxID=282301 RepID=A0A1I8IWB4_9PLAT